MLFWSEQRSNLKPVHTHTHTHTHRQNHSLYWTLWVGYIAVASALQPHWRPFHRDSVVIHSDQQHDSRDARDPDIIVLLGCLTRPISAEVVIKHCRKKLPYWSRSLPPEAAIMVEIEKRWMVTPVLQVPAALQRSAEQEARPVIRQLWRTTKLRVIVLHNTTFVSTITTTPLMTQSRLSGVRTLKVVLKMTESWKSVL